MIKKKIIALLLAVLTMLLAAGCGNDGEELSRDPESMAAAYMKAFIECDTETALNAANIDAIRDMLWYYSGDDYSYSEFEEMWNEMYDTVLARRSDPDASEMREMLSEEYGDDYKISCEVAAVRNATSDELEYYGSFWDMWSNIEYSEGKVVSVRVSISGSGDSSSDTFDVPVMNYDGQWLIPIDDFK